MAPPPLLGVLETALYVGDLDRSAEFYARLLDAREVLREGARMIAMRLPTGEMLLLFRRGASLSPSDTTDGSIPPHDGAGELHLAFGIAPQALAAWRAHLSSQEIAIESEVTPNGGASLYVRDPDRHLIELATPNIWPDSSSVDRKR